MYQDLRLATVRLPTQELDQRSAERRDDVLVRPHRIGEAASASASRGRSSGIGGDHRDRRDVRADREQHGVRHREPAQRLALDPQEQLLGRRTPRGRGAAVPSVGVYQSSVSSTPQPSRQKLRSGVSRSKNPSIGASNCSLSRATGRCTSAKRQPDLGTQVPPIREADRAGTEHEPTVAFDHQHEVLGHQPRGSIERDATPRRASRRRSDRGIGVRRWSSNASATCRASARRPSSAANTVDGCSAFSRALAAIAASASSPVRSSRAGRAGAPRAATGRSPGSAGVGPFHERQVGSCPIEATTLVTTTTPTRRVSGARVDRRRALGCDTARTTTWGSDMAADELIYEKQGHVGRDHHQSTGGPQRPDVVDLRRARSRRARDRRPLPGDHRRRSRLLFRRRREADHGRRARSRRISAARGTAAHAGRRCASCTPTSR